MGGDAALCTPPPPPPPAPPGAPPSPPPPLPPPPSVPPHIFLRVDAGGVGGSEAWDDSGGGGTENSPISVTYDEPTVITFGGNYSLDEGDWVAWVPVTDGGCLNATSTSALSSGPLDASRSVTLQEEVGGTPSGTYVLCFAKAPINGTFPGDMPQSTDFTYAPDVVIEVVHAPPAGPPVEPPSLPPDIN
eukprot:6116358-Prymnesium_polylepis.1